MKNKKKSTLVKSTLYETMMELKGTFDKIQGAKNPFLINTNTETLIKAFGSK